MTGTPDSPQAAADTDPAAHADTVRWLHLRSGQPIPIPPGAWVCQVFAPSVRDDLPCPSTESGGYRCERTDPHDEDGHWISDHTARHARAGNGYTCWTTAGQNF